MLSFLAFLLTTPITFILFPLIVGLIIRNKKWKKSMYILAILFNICNLPIPCYSKKQKNNGYKEFDHPLPEGKVYKYGIVLVDIVSGTGTETA